MPINKLPPILLSLSLLLLPGAFWLEKNQTSLWNNRLLWPQPGRTINLHTPHHTTGTYLPSTISTDRTLTPADNPVILSAPTTIQSQTTLTLQPGVHIYALEHASLHIDGVLDLQGTAPHPVRLTSNESHPANRSWSGLTISSTGHLVGQHADIIYAAPAITCLTNAQVNLHNIFITETNTGVFTMSNHCLLQDSRIQARHTGVISTIANPPLTNTTITAPHQLTVKQP